MADRALLTAKSGRFLTPLDDPASPEGKAKIVEVGVGIFFTDYSISPADLAVALEERGFDSLWAPEHSHIPVPRRTPPPGGGELPKPDEPEPISLL
jgi:hypothetical protein